MEVVKALRRLGFIDRPSVGDHVHLWKLVQHPKGRTTVRTGLDLRHLGRSDVDRIRGDTKLEDDDMWKRALRRKLPRDEYDKHLLGFERADLVIAFWRDKVREEDA